jgi:sulfatase maturation enzyme AslB (radical SAM superfamily)
VSIDGLQPEHDERRKPATYDRILKHIVGHQVTVHCTITRQQVQREGYLEEFVRFWSENQNTHAIWVSLYTPQVGEQSAECLTAADRVSVVANLQDLRSRYPKIQIPVSVIDAMLTPPESPQDCVFARTTECVSADFQTRITPCQFGGTPDCSRCGCLASAGLAAVGRYKLAGTVSVESLLDASFAIGRGMRKVREAVA